MNKKYFINILYNLAVSSSREVHFEPLITKTLQRLMGHMDFPCGMLFIRNESDEPDVYSLAKAIGDRKAIERTGSDFRIPKHVAQNLLLKTSQNSELIGILPCRQGFYSSVLQLPIPDVGWIFLLSPRKIAFDFPMDVMFLPFLANFGIAIRLSRSNDQQLQMLERMVNERTQELKLSNEQLLAEAQERKKTQLALQHSEEQLRNIFDNLQDAFVRCDARGRITKFSPSALRLFSCDNLAGKSLVKFSADAALCRIAFQKLKENGGHLDNFRLKVRGCDRKLIWVSVSVHALYDGSGEIVGFEGTGRDVTESVRAHEDLSRSSRKIAQLLTENQRLARELILTAENEKSMLAKELHDQVGQALTVINTSASIIASTCDDAEIGKIAEDIGHSASSVMQDIREVSKRLRPYLLDSIGLVAAVEELCKSSGRLTKMDVRFHSRGDFETVPDIVGIVAYRAIQESLTNAIKYSRAKQVSVILMSVPAARNQQARLELEISDDGVGMDTGKEEFSGLGLIGMRERVTAVEGMFWLTSSPGVGTTILISIPLQRGYGRGSEGYGNDNRSAGRRP